MKKIVFLFLQLSVASLLADGVDIDIGGTAITIPAPNGFLPVTGNMPMVNQFLENLVAPQNIRFISFIPEQALSAMRRGELPDLTHHVSVQTAKAVVNTTVTRAGFEKFKQLMRTQNAELVRKTEKEAPGFMDRVNQGMGSDFNVKPDFKFNGVAMLPPHDENARWFAFSSFVNLSARTRDGTLTNFVGTVTTTCLLVKARIFFIYVNGTGDDLHWTRQVSKDWAAAILAANPPDAITNAKESPPYGSLDWNRVVRIAVIGGMVGGLFGLTRFFFRRRQGN